MSYKICRINDMKVLSSKKFDKESHLSEFIESNIILFCADVLGDTYVSHRKEVQASEHNLFAPRMPRVDYEIQCEKSKYLVELKNPKNMAENRSAIGQILSYATMLSEDGPHDMVVVTTKFDLLTARAIKKFALPIRYVFFDGEVMAEYLED